MGCRGSKVRILSPRPFPSSVRIPELRVGKVAKRGLRRGQARKLTSPERAVDPDTRAQPQRSDLFRLLVEEATEYALFVLDTEGRVATWNKGAERLKGYTPEEIIGKHFSTFYPPEAVATGWPDQELEAAKREGRFEDEGWRVRKD